MRMREKKTLYKKKGSNYVLVMALWDTSCGRKISNGWLKTDYTDTAGDITTQPDTQEILPVNYKNRQVGREA
jgi:hypothetical protein